MSDINTWSGSGRLAADPTFYPAEGDKKARCLFRLMNNDSYDKDAPANVINCTCFGKLAEALARNGKKGKEVLVEGAIHTHYDKEKDKNYWSVNCSKICYRGDSKKQSVAEGSAPPATGGDVMGKLAALLNSPEGAAALKAALGQREEAPAEAPASHQPF